MLQALVSRRDFWIFATSILLCAILLQGCTSAPGVGPVTIAQTSLPNGRVNAPYSQMLSASGGVTPYTWAVASGALPAGLTLNPTTGLLSGTPTQTTSMSLLTIRVSDSSSVPQSAVATLTLTVVAAGSITITPTDALPSGQVGVPYTATLTATGGTAPYTWALTGTPPAGLSFNTTTGTLSGTPTVAVNVAPLSFKVTDSSNPVLTQTANLGLTIAPATLVITTATLPNGQLGVPYSTTLAATGGTTPYTWTLTSGTLPAGLGLNAATGTIAGTPTAVANATPLTFKVTDSGNPAQAPTKSITLTIAPANLVITTATLPNGQVGVPFSATLAATGGTVPYTWTTTAGTLPEGLLLNAATGVIAGTPTAASATPLTFKVVDSGAPAQTKSVNLTLTIAPATLVITTTTLPNGQVLVPYNATLAATGGTVPYTWALTSGSLDGLTLNPATGAITGIPLLPVNATQLTFTVTDSGAPAQVKSVNLTLTIAPPGLAITTTSLPNGSVGTPYSSTLAATGGTPPFTWTITAGTLPATLQMNGATGAITGTPTTAVVATPLTFKVVDSGTVPQTQSVNLTLTIAPPALVITTTVLPDGQVGTAYTATLAATGGTPPYTWSKTSGSLDGLTLNPATGAITGVPAATVTASPLTFQVTDSASVSKSVNLTLTITPPTLAITTTTLPDGQVGVAYSATLAATGGTPPYTWAKTSGPLHGLALDPATGIISGIPTSTATAAPLTFQVTDSASVTKSVNLTLTIAPPTLTITTTTLPDGQVGVAYSTTLAATGGVPPYTWAKPSGLLHGLALDPTTGTISGTPTSTATAAALMFQVTDSASVMKSVNLTLTINPATLTITTSSLPDGQVGVAYSTTLAATGGVPPYTWAKTGGLLHGLSLDPTTGTISGTPTSPASAAALVFQVTDSASVMKSVNLTLTITPPTLAITTSSLPDGQVGVAYSTTLAATGGVPPYTWAKTSGPLHGLSLDPATGTISGTPTSIANAAALTFQVTDSALATNSVNLTLTIAPPPPLTITTSSLPDAVVNSPYDTPLAATGGVPPYTWVLITGTFPDPALTLSPSGEITGTPTTAGGPAALTFQLTDSATPTPATQTVDLTLTIDASMAIVLTANQRGATLNQTVNLTATVPSDKGNTGVTWSVTGGGTLTSQTTSAASFQASTPNVYTITATSIAHKNQSASLTVGVTDLAAVPTYHNNLSRDGTNTKEYALTTTNVTATTFGKLFSCSTDAAIYAQPLWVANANIGGGTHNVVIAATMHDSVYAFGADASPCVTYWNQHLVPSNETWGSSNDVGSSDIFPDIGIAGTPVIDLKSNTVYLVAKTKTAGGTYHQRLHALNLADGTERPNSPVEISNSITTSGTCDGSSTVTFNAKTENQQAGLALVNGIVYISWASHSDSDPYHGWIAGYDASSLSLAGVFNASPNLAAGKDYCRAGVRMYGGAPAADANNNLYFVTGNGTFDANSGGSNFGDSVMKLSTSKGLSVADWFTPHNQQNLDSSGPEGGAAILVDQPSAPNAHLLISAGKEGVISVLSRDSLGHFDSSSDQVLQRFNANQAAFSTPSFWQGRLYYAGAGGNANAYTFDMSTGLFNTTPSSTSTATFGYPGATPSISSLESTNGIVWAVDSSNFGTDDTGSRAAGPAILRAYDAANLGRELWNSSQGSGNTAGNAVKYAVPTIANGKVYIGTRGNDTTQGSGGIFGELDVYGLKSN